MLKHSWNCFKATWLVESIQRAIFSTALSYPTILSEEFAQD